MIGEASWRAVLAGAVLLLAAGGSPGWAQDAASRTLLEAVSAKGGRVEALAEFCVQANRSQLRNDAVALAGWRERNRWTVIEGWWTQQSTFRESYAAAKESGRAEFQKHRFRTALQCGLLPDVLRSAAFDPSVEHRAELASLPATPGGAEAGAAGTANRDESPGGAAGGEMSSVATGGAAAEIRTREDAVPADAGPAPTAGGERLTVGEVTLEVPRGWAVTKATPELAVLRQATRGDVPVMMVVASVPLAGDLRQTTFATLRSQFPGTGLELRYFVDATTGNGLPAVFGGDVGKLRGGGTASIRAVGVRVGERVETVMMLNSGMLTHLIDRQRDMEAMVAGFAYKGVPEGAVWDPLRPPAGWGGLSGLWMGTRMQNQLNPLGGMDLLAIREYAVLLPDGRAYFDLPRGGQVMDLDFRAVCERRPKACGRYRMEGASIRIEHRADYGMVLTKVVPFHREGPGRSNFGDGGATLVEMHPVEGQRLSGNFAATSGMSGSMGGQSTSVYSQTFIRFAPDGSYQKSGFTTASFSGAAAAGTANAHRGVESGRYSIDGYTLRLEPTGGSPERYTIVFETVAESPDAVFIDDRAFLRDGRRDR